MAYYSGGRLLRHVFFCVDDLASNIKPTKTYPQRKKRKKKKKKKKTSMKRMLYHIYIQAAGYSFTTSFLAAGFVSFGKQKSYRLLFSSVDGP